MLSTFSRPTRQKTAVLENCMNAVEIETLNGVCELTFAMPGADSKNSYLEHLSLVRWNDTGQFYRVLESADESSAEGTILNYTAEHVIATLIDDVIFGTLQLDNLTTRQSIEKVLALQSTRSWVLGDCDFTRYFSYSWSNENLLVALFSIPDRFDEEFRWVFDTSAYPWKIHLKRLDQAMNPEYYIREGRNLLEASKVSKSREICTRLYALGYGEGVNQLTFAPVNGGKPYIDADAGSMAKYGLVSRIWEDLRFEDPQSLLERAKVLLKGYSQPYEQYSVRVADLEKLTGEKYDRAEAGKIVWFEGYKTYITQVQRYLQEDGKDVLELANAPVDIASSIADLADRQRINAVYAQGATCLYSQQYNDNADPNCPAVIRFYVPNEARQINKVILSWSFERFRAYSIGAENTPTTVKSTSAGGRSTSTSSSGGGSNQTSSSGGGGSQTSSSGGGSSQTSKSGGEGENTSGASSITTTGPTKANISDKETSRQKGSGTSHYHVLENFASVAYHKHEIAHTHQIKSPGHTHGVEIPTHTHSVNIPSHAHSVSIPSHIHSVNIPDHTHSVEIQGHTHKTIYGIYEGPRANSVSLQVDGVTVPLTSGQTEIDVADKLSVDSSGKIRRGAFHTIALIPNTLTRISATISVQLFIQSEGGGLY